jgi:hypothetical protein
LNYLWWEKPELKAEVPWLLVAGQEKMLVDFVVVTEVAYVSGTWQNRKLLNGPLSHNNHKRDPRK